MTKSEATKGKQGPASRRTRRHRGRPHTPVLTEAQRVLPKAGAAPSQTASVAQAATRHELTKNLNVMPDLKRAGIISGGLLILLIILSVFL